jgi:hypothetical protein
MGEMRNTYIPLVGKPIGMIPLGKSRSRPADNIKIELNEKNERGWADLYGSEEEPVAVSRERGNEPSGHRRIHG